MIISKLILKVWDINIKDLFENNKLIRMRIEFVILVPQKEWMKLCRIRSKFFKSKLKLKKKLKKICHKHKIKLFNAAFWTKNKFKCSFQILCVMIFPSKE